MGINDGVKLINKNISSTKQSVLLCFNLCENNYLYLCIYSKDKASRAIAVKKNIR